jgi:hypothetical protein
MIASFQPCDGQKEGAMQLVAAIVLGGWLRRFCARASFHTNYWRKFAIICNSDWHDCCAALGFEFAVFAAIVWLIGRLCRYILSHS